MGIYKKGENYYIDYYAFGIRKREKIGPSKKLAKDVLHKRKLEIAEKRFLNFKREERIKFRDFSGLYLELHSKPNKKSWKSADINNLKNLNQFFGDKLIQEITPELAERYKILRREKVSPATVNRELACLKHMFNKAVEWNKLENNPIRNVKLFKEQNRRFRYLEKEEIKVLLDNCSERLRPIVILALNTGMRRGEILNLKWHDIDFNRGIIYLLNTKNNERREVIMNDMVKRALIKVEKHPDSPYVFCDKAGRPFKTIRTSFYTALKKSGIINFRFHDLRHTFASHLVMAGIDLNTVKELLGHKSIEMTLRYSHLSPTHKRRAVEILEAQMDTNWTPKLNKEDLEKLTISQLFDNIEVKKEGPIAQLVRAPDS